MPPLPRSARRIEDDVPTRVVRGETLLRGEGTTVLELEDLVPLDGRGPAAAGGEGGPASEAEVTRRTVLADLRLAGHAAPARRSVEGATGGVPRRERFVEAATRITAPPLAGAMRSPAVGGGRLTPVPVSSPAPVPVAVAVARADGSTVVRRFFDVVTAVPEVVRALARRAGRVRAPEEAILDGAQDAPATFALAARLRTLPLLDGIPDALLAEAARSGAARLLACGRDDLLDPSLDALLVVDGQLALGCFHAAALRKEAAAQRAAATRLDARDSNGDDAARGRMKAAKKEARRRAGVGPLVRLAVRNLAFFESGDLVDLRLPAPAAAAPAATDDLATEAPSADDADATHAYGVSTVTPATVLALARPLLDAWKRAHPAFADRLRRASLSAQRRIDAVVGARAEVADFFLRHGLSIALVARVRQIDACISCGACEAACEERHGKKRLSLHGRILGGLDFVDACHTCTDQRCIDPCAFDAIRFDAERREVVIVEAACTGCTLCATACPYRAIEMHDLDDAPLLRLRLEREGKLAFGDGTPRKARLKRMASKCDHCVEHADQACISACPTGALFDASPADLFQARDGAHLRAADAGFDHTALVDARALLDPRPFAEGLPAARRDALDRARAIRPRILTSWMWIVGLVAVAAVALEIALRKLAPALSVDFLYQTLVDGIEPDIALLRVDYRPGCTLAVRAGIVGSLLLASGMLYPARRRLGRLRHLGSQRAWLDMHVLTGVIGALFILLHSAARLDNWVSLGVWSMIATVGSGLLGRYFITQLPERASAAVLEVLDAGRRLDQLRPRHPAAVAACDSALARRRVALGAMAARRPALLVLLCLLVDHLGAPLRRLALARRLAAFSRPVRKEAVHASLGLARAERRRLLYPAIEPLFRRWKRVHVPCAIALTGIASLHIVLSLFF